jgi:hypothetical protein
LGRLWRSPEAEVDQRPRLPDMPIGERLPGMLAPHGTIESQPARALGAAPSAADIGVKKVEDPNREKVVHPPLQAGVKKGSMKLLDPPKVLPGDAMSYS